MPEVGSTPPPVSPTAQNQAARPSETPPPPPPRERNARVLPNQTVSSNPLLGQRIDIII